MSWLCTYMQFYANRCQYHSLKHRWINKPWKTCRNKILANERRRCIYKVSSYWLRPCRDIQFIPRIVHMMLTLSCCVVCRFRPSLPVFFNSLRPRDAIWRHKSGSTLARVMACCLTAPSHYLNQCWLTISEVWWHSSEGNFIRDTSATIH